MAKTGLIYYTIDTNRYQDRRIKRLKKDFKCDGISVYDYIVCEIYRVEGCFLVWDENTAFDVSEYFGLKETTVKEIVLYCGAVGLFDKELLSRGMITSLSIQRRYLEMCKRAKRMNVEIPDNIQIHVISEEIPEETPILPEIIPKTTEDLPQSKVKKSIVNKTPPSEEIQEEVDFFDLIIPIEDGTKRNWDGLKRHLRQYSGSENDLKTIIAISNYGEIGHPVWGLIADIANSKGKINQPVKFLISRLTQTNKRT